MILAKLAHAPVAQGIVFLVVLYFFSILKGLSMKFFGLALLGILVSFAGIYTVSQAGPSLRHFAFLTRCNCRACCFRVILSLRNTSKTT